MSFYEWLSVVALILAGFWAVGMLLLKAYKKILKEESVSNLTRTRNQNERLKREVDSFNSTVTENKLIISKLIGAMKSVDEKLKIAKEDISSLIQHVNITDKNFDTGIKETIRTEIKSHVVNRDWIIAQKKRRGGE